MRLIILYLCLFGNVYAQQGWVWTELSEMPEASANNAVIEAEVNGNVFAYSFGGIDTSKVFSGIHQNNYKYSVNSNTWSILPNLPDTLGKIASGASYVNGKIYIIGGYHVLANGSEISSNKVHIFDPLTDTFLSDGAPIPIPIDDQVQCVWRDSLIFSITGWSNTGNKPWVQIYNPYTDTWQSGTSTPLTNNFMAFGASGVIIGDTIYYNGGAAGNFSFVNRPYLRKGIIDPSDPTQITWVQEMDNPGDAGYRMACVAHQNQAFWIGGSGVAYNYDGIAYDGSGGVSPLTRILRYNTVNATWDLRGIAQIDANKWIVCGGMMNNQQVSKRTFLLEYVSMVSINQLKFLEVDIFPNPTKDVIHLKDFVGYKDYSISNVSGKQVLKGSMIKSEIDVKNLPAGAYIGHIISEIGVYRFRFVKV